MKMKLKALAAMINAEIEGDEEAELSGFAKIEEANRGELTFLANPKYAHYIYSTNATAVLVRNDFIAERPLQCTLLRVEDPYSTLAEILEAIDKMKPLPKGVENPSFVAADVELPEGHYVGAFAYIGRGVKLGKNVLIYPQAYIGESVEIGDDTVIRAGVKIYEGCRIGKRCIIHSGAVIGADGFGFAPKDGRYEKIPQTGNVIIEDDVEIGANTAVDRATFGSTVIGKGTKLDNLMQVAHNVTIGENNVFAAQTGIAGSTQIGSGNRVGGQCGFAGHIKVGDNNEFGAQSGIPNSIGSNRRVIGYPAIDAMQFAKLQVYFKRLPKLFEQ